MSSLASRDASSLWREKTQNSKKEMDPLFCPTSRCSTKKNPCGSPRRWWTLSRFRATIVVTHRFGFFFGEHLTGLYDFVVGQSVLSQSLLPGGDLEGHALQRSPWKTLRRTRSRPRFLRNPSPLFCDPLTVMALRPHHLVLVDDCRGSQERRLGGCLSYHTVGSQEPGSLERSTV